MMTVYPFSVSGDEFKSADPLGQIDAQPGLLLSPLSVPK